MDKLLKAIKQHYEQEHNREEQEEEEVQVTLTHDGGDVHDDDHVLFARSRRVVATFVQVKEDEGAEENAAPACEEEIFSPAVFVNTRRGRGNGTKRKISDTATDASIPPRAAPVRPSAQPQPDTCHKHPLYTANKTCKSLFLREGWWWGGWAQRNQKEEGNLYERFRGHRCQRRWQ